METLEATQFQTPWGLLSKDEFWDVLDEALDTDLGKSKSMLQWLEEEGFPKDSVPSTILKEEPNRILVLQGDRKVWYDLAGEYLGDDY